MLGNSKKKYIAASVILSFAVLLSSCGKAASSGDVTGDVTDDAAVDVTSEIITEEHRTVDTEGTISLDDSRFVTLDQNSSMQIDREGNATLLELTEGMLFFNIAKKLGPDESLSIVANGTTVDIHGTSGVISVNDKGRYSLYLTDGEVKITARNPETGEEKTQTVTAPAKVSVYLYSDRPMGQTLEFVVVPLEPDMLPPFAVNQIYSDEELMAKITEQSGWTVTGISNVHDMIEDGSYEPAISDAVLLGIAEPDDIAKAIGLVADAPVSPAELSEADQVADDDQGVNNAAGDAPGQEEPATSADGRQFANAQIAPSTPNSLGVAYIREDGIWVLTDGTLFDPAFYAASDPEVVKAFGNDPNALLQHYLLFGRYENRPTYLSEEVRLQQELERKNQEVIEQLLWAQINAQNQPPAPEPAPEPAPGPEPESEPEPEPSNDPALGNDPENDPNNENDPDPGNDPNSANDPDPEQIPEVTVVNRIEICYNSDSISSVYYVESDTENDRIYKAKIAECNEFTVEEVVVEEAEYLLYYGSGIYIVVNDSPLDDISENVESAYTYVGFAESIPVCVCETNVYENPIAIFEEAGENRYETELPDTDLTLTYYGGDQVCGLDQTEP